MTPSELRELADKMDQEQKPIKVGYLKYDLYDFNSEYGFSGLTYRAETPFWLFTEKQKEEIIKDFENRFKLVLRKGSKFVCFLLEGKESWYDDENYGCENMDTKWANKYLENITKEYNSENKKN